MFSRLEAILKSNFIPIRESDPHPDLNHDKKEKDNKQTRQNKKTDAQHAEFDDDTMIISVAALHNFLNELTHAPNIMHDFLDQTHLRHDKKEKTGTAITPNSETARAIQAYKHMADESNNPPLPEKIGGRIDRMLYHLTNDEKKMVGDLITSLQILKNSRITELSISSNQSFFVEIVDAIKKAQNEIDHTNL